MRILVGADLDPEKYFSGGGASPQGSSFNLTIGHIYDNNGQEVDGPFVLKPGHMVQVASAEVFNLPDNVTGHVTYKTELTREGVWALTVGIVDPGWDGPVATTLLNFSSVSHTIHRGHSFLRVSLFEHDPVPPDRVRKSKPVPEYLKEIQTFASSRFPPTFLNSDKISEDAGKKVFDRIRTEGLAWLGVIVIVFTLIQIFAPPAAKWADEWVSPSELTEMRAELRSLRSEVSDLEAQLETLNAPVENSSENP